MCLLSYYPEGIIPNDERLFNGAVTNMDGFGYAIATPGRKLFTGRGLDADLMIGEFMRMRRKHPQGPAMFHSRYGTSGGIRVSNCHPFQVGRDKLTVVGHNGVLFNVHKGKRCDTRIFAEDVMGESYPALDSKRTRLRLEAFLGFGNKLAVITVNPLYQHMGYLFNEKQGTWADGEWHSNSGYKPPVRRYQIGAGFTSADWEAEREKYSEEPGWLHAKDKGWETIGCLYCGVPAVDPATMYCAACHTCQDCFETEEACLCYLPAGAREKLGLPEDDEEWEGEDAATWDADDVMNGTGWPEKTK